MKSKCGPKLCSLVSCTKWRCFQNQLKTTRWLYQAVTATWTERRVLLDHPRSITVRNNWDGQLLLGSRGLCSHWAISSIYLQINVTLLKWPLKNRQPPTLTTCLLVPLSRHVVATLSYLGFFSPQTRLLRWDPGLDQWCQREGLMVCALCTVYKSISDGSVCILATFNLIKWKHGEKNHQESRQQSFFRLFPHVRARTHACTRPGILFTMDWALKAPQKRRNQI